jgi:hypothetical protein
VVETTNFSSKHEFMGSDEGLHLIERFTRTDPDTILYEFKIDDPATFSRPWSGVLPMRKTQDQLFPYTCHEGNYTMEGILAGARAAERRAAEADAIIGSK